MDDSGKIAIALLSLVKQRVEDGKTEGQIVDELVDKGVEEIVAKNMVANSIKFIKDNPSASVLKTGAASGKRDFGCFLLVIGIAVTAYTYYSAGPGESYVVCWGPILVGLIYLFSRSR